MDETFRRAALVTLSAVALACSREEPASTPPPLPYVASHAEVDSEAARPSPTAQRESSTPALPKRESATSSASASSKARAAAKVERDPSIAKPVRKPKEPRVADPAVETRPTRASAAASVAPSPATPASLKKRVTVPRTEHVHVEISAGLQADLDADPRMQSWIDRVIAAADACHARARSATGTIEVLITMHENARPSVDVRALPGQLSGVVACATGALMRVKMPLFTGREGTRHSARILFE